MAFPPDPPDDDEWMDEMIERSRTLFGILGIGAVIAVLILLSVLL